MSQDSLKEAGVNNQQAKRGPGRPPQGSAHRVHMDLTLSAEVVKLLREMPAGMRSKFVDDWLRQHPQIAERLAQP